MEKGGLIRFKLREERENGSEVLREEEVRIIIKKKIGIGMVEKFV